MANGSGDLQRNHTKYIVSCITAMGITCSIVGGILIYKGYHADLLISGVIAAISGMTGLLGQSKPNQLPPDITMTGGQNGQPPQVTVTQQQPKPSGPLPVTVENPASNPANVIEVPKP